MTSMIKFGGNFVSLCRSLNHSEYDLENFYENFEITLDTFLTNNPSLVVAISDFNVKYNNWYTDDTTKTFEGSKIKTISSQFGL